MSETIRRRKTCALTGHRELPDRGFDLNGLHDQLEELILDGCDEFLCGMAMGFDLIALRILVDLAAKYRYRFRMVAYIPFEGQENRFSEKWRELYRILRGICHEERVLYSHSFNGCFLARDREMVDHADLVLAYCTKSEGGTAYTVAYAKSKNVPVIMFGS